MDVIGNRGQMQQDVVHIVLHIQFPPQVKFQPSVSVIVVDRMHDHGHRRLELPLRRNLCINLAQAQGS